MDVRSFIKAHFGIDLEISGGPGNSYEQAVTILIRMVPGMLIANMNI